MIVGGSTTSLLSILNNLDYTQYEVDLLLFDWGGDLFDLIPREVNILPQANLYDEGNKKLLVKRLFSISYLRAFLLSRVLTKKHQNPLLKSQIMSYQKAKFSRKLESDYDVAISFLEFWPAIMVSDYIKAKKKITWLHIDYKNTRLIPKYDEACYNHFNKIVLVSPSCVNNFINIFPQYKEKTICIENIVSSKTIRTLSNAIPCELQMDASDINLISVCRIDFLSKGLDRGVEAIRQLKKDVPILNLKWYIIGDGQDALQLKALIQRYDLEKYVILLGKKINPFPYIKKMDLFFLPSRYEGKPMAVTEAMILGVPPFVTNYASANHQIKQDVEGIIVNNTDEDIYIGLKMILNNREKINRMKAYLKTQVYSNEQEMENIYRMIEE